MDKVNFETLKIKPKNLHSKAQGKKDADRMAYMSLWFLGAGFICWLMRIFITRGM